MPNKRLLASANAGKVDAEVGRIEKALPSTPNLRKVRVVPIVNIIGVAVTDKGERPVN